MKRALGCASVLIVVAVVIAIARGQTPEQNPAPESVVRLYDIRDLLVYVPDFVGPEITFPQEQTGTGGGGGGGATGLFGGGGGTAGRVKTRDQLTDELVKSITESVAPDSWKQAGGNAGTIQERHGVLIIRQTPENQKRMEEYLAACRKADFLAPVRIRALWILTRRGELDSILRPARVGPASTQPLAPNGATSTPLLEADESALDRITGAVHYRGEVLCTNGQRVCVAASTEQLAIPAPPNVDANPGQSVTQAGGLVLDAQSQLGADGAGMVLTIRSHWASFKAAASATTRAGAGPSTAPASGGGANAGNAGPAETMLHEIRTTVHIPLGKLIFIGGMTLNPDSNRAPQPAPTNLQRPVDEPVQLYLFVEATSQQT